MRASEALVLDLSRRCRRALSRDYEPLTRAQLAATPSLQHNHSVFFTFIVMLFSPIALYAPDSSVMLPLRLIQRELVHYAQSRPTEKARADAWLALSQVCFHWYYNIKVLKSRLAAQ